MNVKIILVLLFTCTLVFSKVYYSKIEPYELRTIASNVSGKILFTDDNMIGKKLSNKVFIKIDSELDKDELKAVNKKLVYQNNILKLDVKVLENLKQMLVRKKVNYKKIENLKIKSRIEKDKEFYDLVSSENSYLATQKEINNLKINISDLKLKKQQLLKSINDKNICADNFVLYAILVKAGQSVNPTTPLAKVADTSKGLLSIYLDEDDLVGLKNKTIFIDGKKTDYKIARISYIADEKNISKYKAQIIIKTPKIFSKLVKIELKERTDEK